MPTAIRPRILLIGSEPFGGLTCNPAAEVARRYIGATLPGAEIVGAVLPVSFNELPARVAALVAARRPDAALGLGLFHGAAAIRIETTAINRADFDVADNRGAFVRNATIDSRGPAARTATYDAPGLATALRQAGVPARVSHHAGTHLCNLTLYTLLGAFETCGLRGPVGFIHLPLLPDQAAEALDAEARVDHERVRLPLELPSMDLETQIRAVGIVLGLLAEAAIPPAERERTKAWT